MHKSFFSLGALFGALAVVLGAFGAHGLKKMVSADAIAVFQTGVQYQMYHALALLITGMLHERLQNRLIKWAGYLFCVGILFFSGSLYVIGLMNAAQNTVPVLIGILTPVGGLVFIVGWVCLLTAVITKNRS
jgi:uncharacterized membrane protein YgdD (TMEM256/DUF423 family)